MNQIGNIQFIERCSLVSTLGIALFSGPMKLNEKSAKIIRPDSNTNKIEFKIENWLSLLMSMEVMEDFFTLIYFSYTTGSEIEYRKIFIKNM